MSSLAKFNGHHSANMMVERCTDATEEKSKIRLEFTANLQNVRNVSGRGDFVLNFLKIIKSQSLIWKFGQKNIVNFDTLAEKNPEFHQSIAEKKW